MTTGSALHLQVMGEAEAQQLTERIRNIAQTVRAGMEELQRLAAEAKAGSAHLALGYRSWTAYLSDVLGRQPLQLERAVREDLAWYLAAQGMSVRAIAPMVGVSPRQVSTDVQAAGVKSLHTTPALSGATVVGLDGKRYARQRRETRQGSRERPVEDDLDEILTALMAAQQRLVELLRAERFERNARALVDARHEALTEVVRFSSRLGALVAPVGVTISRRRAGDWVDVVWSELEKTEALLSAIHPNRPASVAVLRQVKERLLPPPSA